MSRIRGIKSVAAFLGVSDVTIYRWIASNGFPAPYKSGTAKNSAAFWDVEEIENWMRARKAR